MAQPLDPRSFNLSVVPAGAGAPVPGIQSPMTAPSPIGGAPQPTQTAAPGGAMGTGQPQAPVVNLPTVQARPLHVVMEDERKQSEVTQAVPYIAPLAGYIRQCFSQAAMAKRQTVEPRMLQSIRARRSEYDPEKLAQIRATGGAETYANLTSVKCRSAASWIRDVMMGQGEGRPWAIRPTPVPDLPPEVNDSIVANVAEAIKQTILAGMPQPTDADVLSATLEARDAAMAELVEKATSAANRMADMMEDQLVEGGFLEAMDAFIDDITTFPAAVIKGPVIRNKPCLKWMPDPAKPGSFTPTVTTELKLGWERVSPLKIYPSPSATTVDDGYLIELHSLSRGDLTALIDVEGYDTPTIRTLLEQYSHGGLRDWTVNLSEQDAAEGRAPGASSTNADGLIDAVQFWGSVQGQWLIDWGMDEAKIPDPTKEYHVEAWLIGPYVIKAVLNYDPLDRKPYYKACYEDVPGSWWGNSVCDLVRDSQSVVNATARALVNNMGMASGPQVAINVSRLAPGQKITTLQPWKIWQTVDDQYGGSVGGAPAVSFFQPESNVQQLLQVFEKFSTLADEYSGIPRYLSGDTTGGAGRTASGLSMLINNAGKAIKQVISSIDIAVMTPLLERLYTHNMQFAEDTALKGDVNIVAQGAEALLTKEAVQQRRNEFLQTTNNPVDMQIVGVLGRAAILRETAKDLGMDVNDVVPPVEVLKAKFTALAKLQAAQGQAGAEGEAGPGAPAPGAQGPAPTIGSGQALMDGTPTTDNMGPPPKP